ncbi:MAG TPA: protease pro-enzyme activation domain-containing protein [Solirubrobacteraceae bacterium]
MVLGLGCTALAGAGPVLASAAGARATVGAAAPLPHGARILAPRAPSSSLALTVALQSQDPAGMAAAASAVADPSSPQFRHYLTVSEFAARFGAAPDRVAAISSALRAAGLTVGAPAANGLSLPVSGSTAAVEHAFATSIAGVQLPGGRQAYANTSAPTLTPDVAPDVQDVIGLSTVVQAQSHAVSARSALSATTAPQAAPLATAAGGPAPCASASGAHGYTADTVAAAYGLSPLYTAGDLGAGQTVAVYELEPYSPSDVATYQSCYATATPIVNVPVDGAGTYTGGDDVEAALDIEQVVGLAPQATIRVYTAPNGGAGPYDAYAHIASDNVAKVVTSSWGVCEAQVAAGNDAYARAENNLFSEMALQGQGVMVASGDSGSAACDQSDPTNTSLSVGDPASLPFATGVGGSSLATAASGTPGLWSPGQPLDEGVWNEGTSGGEASATGGGVSSEWGMPSYQSGAAPSLGVVNAHSSPAPCAAAVPGSTYCRQVPDVSANADLAFGYSIYATDSSGSGWGTVAGTSAAAPVWAALMALANAQASCRGKTIGFANPSLYALAGSNDGALFRDVSLANPETGKANNDALGSNGGLYPVTAGYDMTTGLGVPGAGLAGALCALRAPANTITYAVPSQLSPRGRALTLATHATDSGNVGVTYGASGLPPGLAINTVSGTVSGTPSANGSYPVTIIARDNDGNVAVTKFTWTVVSVGQPTAAGVRLSGVSQRRPRLSFTMHAGLFAPSLRSVSITVPGGLSFARQGRAVTAGLTVKAGRTRVGYRASVRHGVLTVRLRRTTGAIFVAVATPTLSASLSLAAQARRRRTLQVRIGLVATDAAGGSTRRTVALRLGR